MRLIKIFVVMAAVTVVVSLSGIAAQNNARKASIKREFKPSSSTKGVAALPGPFWVKQVMFNPIEVGGQTRLSAAVIFNTPLIDTESLKNEYHIRFVEK